MERNGLLSTRRQPGAIWRIALDPGKTLQEYKMKNACVLGLVLFGFLAPATAAPVDRADAALASTFGPRYASSGLPARPTLKKGTDALHRWNQVAIDTTG